MNFKVCISLLFLMMWFFSIPYPTAAIEVAITVDDLPLNGFKPMNVTNQEIADKMISAFKKHGIKDVYGFINGGEVEGDPANKELLKSWVRAGHRLGNHTYTHTAISDSSIESVKENIIKNEALLNELSEDKNFKYFRFPYLDEGYPKEKQIAIRTFLEEQDYKIAQVSLDFSDWAWMEPNIRCSFFEDKESLDWLKEMYIKSALESLKKSEMDAKKLFDKEIKYILLLHINVMTADVLDELLTLYKNNGVTFIDLKTAVDDPVYKNIPDFIPTDGWPGFMIKHFDAQNIDAGFVFFESIKEELSQKCTN